MATTTPNFGWDIPQSTDLVKDGATAIAALGTDIDTALVDLKGGTTGQVLSKASNTDLDFTWSSVDPLTILDAKGDLITATAADTPARLAVGANGTYLQADSTTSTGLKWGTVSAGGMTLLSTTTLSGTSTTISSISQDYNSLFILCYEVNINANSNFTVDFNNASITASYSGVAEAVAGSLSGSPISIRGNQVNIASGNADNVFLLELHNYSTSAGYKPFNFFGQFVKQGGGYSSVNYGGGWASSTAITSLYFAANTNTFNGGTIKIYGVK